MKQPIISIIVPVFNIGHYLNKCIQSIVDQTYDDLQIILVDDGSSDDSSTICDEWGQKDNRIIVIHKENGGLSDARNKGLSIASGEYIGFVDGDDWIAPEMMERLLKAILNDKSDIAACAVKMIWENSEATRMFTFRGDCVLNREEAQKALLEETLLKQPVWYKLYKKDIINGLSFEVGKHHEDMFWSYQAIGNANQVSTISYIGYYYLQRKDSIMGKIYSKSRLDALEAIEKRYHYIEKRFPSLETEAKVSITESCIYHGQMILKHINNYEKDELFARLNNLIKKYRLRYKEINNLKLTHQLWIVLSLISLKLVCYVKNKLNVGL